VPDKANLPIHQSRLLVHLCPSVMKRVIYLKLGRADRPVRLLGFGSRAVRSDWRGKRRTGRSALPFLSVSICVHLWLNIRENSRNSRQVSPASKKLSPYVTIYQHRNFMNSTPKATSGASRKPFVLPNSTAGACWPARVNRGVNKKSSLPRH
jgi:hypothetical protein